MTNPNLAEIFAVSLAACLRGEQPIEMVQYAARKRNPDLGQPSLFETSNQPHLDKLGPGRWITIHSEKGEHGNRGGHAVYLGDDGKMKTGKFAGKSMAEAFGAPKPKGKRLAKRGAKHEQGQPGLFETEAQPTLPGIGPGNHTDVGAIGSGKSGLAVDPSELRGSNIRTLSGMPDREINNRRLAASKRRLRLEREAVPLLSDQVAELQPTPEQRIRDMDKLTKARFEGFDKKQKEVWDRTVDELSQLPPDEQKRFMAYWNSGQQPDDPAYFATALAKFKSGKVKTDAIVDRSDIADPEKRKRVERLDRSLATLQDIHSKAKSEGGKEYASQRIAEVQAQIASEVGEPKGEDSPAEPPAVEQSTEQPAADNPHQAALDRAKPYRQHGQDYDRTVATRASRLESAMQKGHGPAMRDHLAGELTTGIDALEQRTSARDAEAGKAEPTADNSESKQPTPENSRSKFRQLMQEQDADDRRKDPGRFAQEWIHNDPTVDDIHKDLMESSGHYRSVKKLSDDEALSEPIPPEGDEYSGPVGKAEQQRQQMVAEEFARRHPDRMPEFAKTHFGIKPESKPGIVEAPKTVANDKAKPGDQLGLFGEATKPTSTEPPKLKGGGETSGKAQNLFDTHGDKDQMDLFGDGVMPESMVYQPGDKKAAAEKETAEAVQDFWTKKAGQDSTDKPKAKPKATGKDIESDERYQNPHDIRPERRGGLALTDHDSALQDFQDAHDSHQRAIKAKADDMVLKYTDPSDDKHARTAANHDQAIASAERKKKAAFRKFMGHADRVAANSAELESESKKKDESAAVETESPASIARTPNVLSGHYSNLTPAADRLATVNTHYSPEEKRQFLRVAVPHARKTQAQLMTQLDYSAQEKAKNETGGEYTGPNMPMLWPLDSKTFDKADNPPAKNTVKPGDFMWSPTLSGKPALLQVLSRNGKKQKLQIVDGPEDVGATFDWHADNNNLFFRAATKREINKLVKGGLHVPSIGVAEVKPAETGESAHATEPNENHTPRQAAAAAQKQLDADYEFARASSVGNVGEDLKGSARHRVNAWRGLAEAEKDGTAEKMVTRDQLAKLEPHNLISLADKNPLTSLAMNFAMRAFPAKPGSHSRRSSGDAAKNRQEYLDAYRSVKDKAEQLAGEHGDANSLTAIKSLQTHVGTLIDNLRSQERKDEHGNRLGRDRFNATANDLVKLHNALSTGFGATKTGVIGRLNEFSKAVQDKYGSSFSELSKSGSLEDKKTALQRAAEHAKDIMEGASLNKSFGKVSKAAKRFSAADRYVKQATRKGGRDVSAVTSDPNKATKHLVDSFGMRGVQWGNTVTDDERKHHAGRVVEAMTDLADTVGLHPKDIALDGKLGLAIGARGKGTAIAHYEPGSQVINLTRAKGVGTLAHEWGHAFDHMLEGFGEGNFGTKYMSELHENTHEVTSKDGHTWGIPEAHREPMARDGRTIKERPMIGVRKAYAEWKKASRGFQDRMKDELKSMVKGGEISEKKAGEYWNSGREVFARSFEQHVQHKLREDGRDNTYLTGLSQGGGLWPTAEESKAMAPAFDKIFEEYRKHKHGSPDKVKFSQREAYEAFWGAAHADRYSATEAQREAGNYKMRKVRIHGLSVSIETPKGQRRRPQWPPMPADYGYIRGTMGRDGDHVDVFLGPDHRSELVVVVDQVNQDGKFDEHKVLAGFRTEADAIETYKKAYQKGWKVGPVTCMTIKQFKAWLSDGSQKRKLSSQVSKYSAWEDQSDLSLVGDLIPFELVRYDWNSALHPRNPAGAPQSAGGEFTESQQAGNRPGGAVSQRFIDSGHSPGSTRPAQGGSAAGFTKSNRFGGVMADKQPSGKQQATQQQPAKPSSIKRELAHRPQIDRSHALHYSQLGKQMSAKLLDWNSRIHEALKPMDIMPPTVTKLSHAEQEEAGWGNVDKNKIRELLAEMNQMDREAKANGVPLSDYVNASGLIPENLALRLDGGSRFFNPELLGSKIRDGRREPAQTAVQPQDDQGPAYSPQPQRPGPAPAPEPAQPAPTGLTKRQENKLDKTVKEYVGDSPRAAAHFKSVALDAWKSLRNEAEMHNDAMRDIMGQFTKKGFGGIASAVSRGADLTKISGWDEIVDYAEKSYPHIVSHVASESEGGSGEEGLVKALQKGIQEVPQPYSEEVMDLASSMVGQSFWDAIKDPYYQDDADVASSLAGSDQAEEIPFSARRDIQAALIRYWNRSTPAQSA